MKAKQSFNAAKADAEEIQHVEIKPVAKAGSPGYLPLVKMGTTNGLWDICLPFRLLAS